MAEVSPLFPACCYFLQLFCNACSPLPPRLGFRVLLAAGCAVAMLRPKTFVSCFGTFGFLERDMISHFVEIFVPRRINRRLIAQSESESLGLVLDVRMISAAVGTVSITIRPILEGKAGVRGRQAEGSSGGSGLTIRTGQDRTRTKTQRKHHKVIQYPVRWDSDIPPLYSRLFLPPHRNRFPTVHVGFSGCTSPPPPLPISVCLHVARPLAR